MKLPIILNHIRNSIRISTLVVMFTAVVIATAAGFAHSYAGLYDWGLAHKLTGWKADTFPLLVDMFILVGELGLFLIALDGLKVRKSLTAWLDIVIPSAVIAAGWGASLWFNVNHLENATQDDKVTFAIPPIAAMIGLMILLRTVHRYAARLEDAVSVPADVPAAPVAPEPVPPVALADVPSVVAPTVPAQWHVALPGTFRVGTESRTVWPEHVAPKPVPAAPVAPLVVLDLDESAGVGTLDVSTNGNGVLSDKSQVARWVTDHLPAERLNGAESHTQTSNPVPVREATADAASATAANSEPSVGDLSTDERHAKGLTYCAEYHTVTGKLPSQRILASHLGMKNRKPAESIITHAKELITNDTLKNYLPTATHTAG